MGYLSKESNRSDVYLYLLFFITTLLRGVDDNHIIQVDLGDNCNKALGDSDMSF